MTIASDTELQQAAGLLADRRPEAGERLQALCRLHPADWRLQFLHGAWLERAGRNADALAALDRALGLDPANVQVLSAKALVLQALGKLAQARELLAAAAAEQPGQGQLWTNLGVLHEAGGDPAAALAAYDRALALAAPPREARLNRGYVLTRLGRLDEALRNNQALVDAEPDAMDARFNLAEVLLALRRYDEARAICDGILQADPAHVKARIDRALADAALGNVDRAQRDLDRVRDLDATALMEFNHGFARRAGGLLDEFGAFSIWFHLTFERLERCDWSVRDRLAEGLAGRTSRADAAPSDPNLPFRGLGLGLPPATQLALAQGVAAAMQARASKLPAPVRRRSVAPGMRIRVGYASPDYRVHPAGFLTRNLFRMHDRARFEVFGYGLAPSDDSRIANELRAGFDAFRDVSFLDNAAIAQRIADDGIDILVDLAGYTNFSRSEAFALRPAPLNVNWLGYPGTLGARYMDYAVTDGIACPPGAEAHWSEKLVRLPHTYFVTDADPVRDARMPTRAEMGLPDKGFVFCCFNNAWKLDPRMFSVWMDLLAELPDAVFWLLAFNPAIVVNLRREAAARGIDPQRLVFAEHMPNERHLLRYRLADLFTDTLCYNAHTTAIDALREATPVLTMPGETTQSRVGASLLTAVQMPELICADLDDYKRKALELARDPARLAGLRQRLREGFGRAPLFDTPRFVRNLECAYEQMWQRHLEGLPPRAFDVLEAAPQPAPSTRWF
jgi:predicted O-linked N-acetylglucosamine transferase (SPINDLY family)